MCGIIVYFYGRGSVGGEIWRWRGFFRLEKWEDGVLDRLDSMCKSIEVWNDLEFWEFKRNIIL